MLKLKSRYYYLALLLLASHGAWSEESPIGRLDRRPPQSCNRLMLDEAAVVRAEIEEPVEVDGFKFGVGSKMTIRVSADKEIEGLFLGRLVQTDLKSTELLFLDARENFVYLLKQSKTKLKFKGKIVGRSELQPMLDPIEQVSDTCTGYAIDHFLHQLQLGGFKGTGKLNERLSTEIGRRQLLVQAVNDYYLELKHQSSIKGILNTYAEEYGYRCVTLKSQSAATLIKSMLTHLDAGRPLIMEFWIGEDMLTSSYQVVDPYKPPGKDRRLWVPRKTGQKEGGGHAVVASAYFYEPDGNRLKFLVQDSDWNEPRIWDAKEYVERRFQSSGLLVHTCVEK